MTPFPCQKMNLPFFLMCHEWNWCGEFWLSLWRTVLCWFPDFIFNFLILPLCLTAQLAHRVSHKNKLNVMCVNSSDSKQKNDREMRLPPLCNLYSCRETLLFMITYLSFFNSLFFTKKRFQLKCNFKNILVIIRIMSWFSIMLERMIVT